MLGRPLRGRVQTDAVLLDELAGFGELDREPQLLSFYGHIGHGLRSPAPSGTRRTVRLVRRLRSLSETECYVRLYGGWDSTVTLVKIEPRRPRYEPAVSGEDLRREFEARIESRADELMAELDAAEAAAE